MVLLVMKADTHFIIPQMAESVLDAAVRCAAHVQGCILQRFSQKNDGSIVCGDQS